MASTSNAARVEQSEVRDETKMAEDCACDEVHQLAPQQGSSIAGARVHRLSFASDKQSARRSSVFDKLLLVSFGSISPAYSFSAFFDKELTATRLEDALSAVPMRVALPVVIPQAGEIGRSR
jgi:hypothetical protein